MEYVYGHYGSTMLRVALGLFFFSSGLHKLFVPDVRARFVGLLDKLGQGSTLNRWLIPGAEFMGGLALVIGFLTPLAGLGLAIIMMGAIYLDCWQDDVVAKHPRDFLDWVAKAIYMPEGLIFLVLIAIVLMGGGVYSLDHLILSIIR